MLAALLLEANRPVPLARLAAAMWSGLPPKSAVANVRTHAAALRQLLGPRLRARPYAYQLCVQDAELDADEFARLARAGRVALAGDEPAAAAARLGAALALWRGPAGDGVPRGAALDGRFATLDDQRLDAFDNYIEARLHTRAFAEIAAELRRHLSVWPVRERSWGLLIRTLYRSGNAAGALSAYTQARTSLRNQLGIEPGPELQALQRAVLNRDPSLDLRSLDGRSMAAVVTDGAAGGAPAHPVIPRLRRPANSPPARRSPVLPSPPHQLPPQADRLVGREAALATLLARLRGQGGLVVVYGPAGVGKSALAARTAAMAADDFSDGVLTIDLRGTGPAPVPPDDVVGAVQRALGQQPATVEDGNTAHRPPTDERRLLIILDDAASAAQLRPLLGSGIAATLLVTSRRRPAALDGARCIALRPLSDPDAAELLTTYAGASRAADDPATVRELALLCDGLPLALRIVGERLARRPDLPPALLATHLVNRPLDGLRLGELSVRDALAADYRTAAAEDPVAGRAFPLLGRLAPQETATPEALGSKLGEHASRVFHALEHLVDAWLAQSPQPSHYRTAGLTRAYAAELPIDDPAH
jgi:DNA-binding SARP family transcriptional activator